MTSKVAVYAGTFDPVTRGHVDIARKAQAMFDTLIFAVGENPAKRTLFNRAERMVLIRDVVPGANSIHIQVRAEPNEMAWLRPLFTRCKDPFKALRDMGYEPVEKKDAS